MKDTLKDKTVQIILNNHLLTFDNICDQVEDDRFVLVSGRREVLRNSLRHEFDSICDLLRFAIMGHLITVEEFDSIMEDITISYKQYYFAETVGTKEFNKAVSEL